MKETVTSLSSCLCSGSSNKFIPKSVLFMSKRMMFISEKVRFTNSYVSSSLLSMLMNMQGVPEAIDASTCEYKLRSSVVLPHPDEPSTYVCRIRSCGSYTVTSELALTMHPYSISSESVFLAIPIIQPLRSGMRDS